MLRVLTESLTSGRDITSREFAEQLDAAEPSHNTRSEFLLPRTDNGATLRKPGTPALYLCGNSLGLQPRRTRAFVNAELDKWEAYGVEGHFKPATLPWVSIEDSVTGGMAALVGAGVSEVAVMNSLTTDLHLMMAAFYRPTATRFKIITEARAFPSDTYAVKSQLAFHGRDPRDALVELAPRPGEDCLREEDITAAIRECGDSLALVLFSGVQYYTGQLFDIPGITAAAHAAGACAGIDLAHAVGNVPLSLHDWGVDFAVWCSYKYLNSGPGGIAGVFVHDRYASEDMATRPFFAGWWGHERSTRFAMGADFVPQHGAARFQLSNPPVLQVAALRASLSVFTEAGGMAPLRERSMGLTRFLEELLTRDDVLRNEVRIITPPESHRRGAQLSLCLSLPVRDVASRLAEEGVIVDVREPHVLRVAPVPLYNTAGEVAEFVAVLRAIVSDVRKRAMGST